MSSSRKELEPSFKELSLSQKGLRASKPSKSKTKGTPVVDSWEDDAATSSSDDTDRPLTAQESASYPNAPPPTPISPTPPYKTANSDRYANPGMFTNPYFETWAPPSEARGARNTDNRPEKTDAVAKRLVAGALGVRAPKKTDEQKAYERALKEKEIKKRNGEREAKARAEEEATKAKKAAWDD